MSGEEVDVYIPPDLCAQRLEQITAASVALANLKDKEARALLAAGIITVVNSMTPRVSVAERDNVLTMVKP